MERVRNTRAEASNGSNQSRTTKKPFVVAYHPGLPNISTIPQELNPILESSDRCKNTIRNVPFLVFRKPKSVGDYLVLPKVGSRGSKDSILVTVKCSSKRCEVWNKMKERNYFMCSQNDRRYLINYNLNCNSSKVVYLITCKKCS